MIETNKVVRAKHAALAILSGRILPTLASDLKVAALIKGYYATPFAVTEVAREKLVKDVPADWKHDQLPPDLAQRWVTEVLAETQEVPDVPARLRLSEADLPKDVKGNEANRQGVADIIVALSDLFVEKVAADVEKD